MRYFMVLTGLFLLATPTVFAGGDSLAGNWKFTFYDKGQALTFWLLKLESKDGKLNGTTDSMEGIPPTTIKNIKVTDKAMTFDLEVGGKGRGQSFPFEGIAPKAGAKKIYGTLELGRMLLPVVIEATTDKELKAPEKKPERFTFEKAKTIVTKTPDHPDIFEAIHVLADLGKENKVSAEELKKWTETAFKTAGMFGPRFKQEFNFRVVEMMAGIGDYPDLAEDLAQQLVKSLDDKVKTDAKLRGLDVLAAVLKANKKADALATVKARIDLLEPRAHEEYAKTALPYTVDKFKGRKSPGKRVPLVELFTGAQCPPCVAADLAFDGLQPTYGHDVVLLQYHLHIPGPDALTNGDTEDRQGYYKPRGTPSIYFNGEQRAPGGGGKPQAEDKYKEYREVVNNLLEKELAPGLSLTVGAKRSGDKISINAAATIGDKAGDKVKLRFALVEEWARYRGGNGLMFHHHVVRAMPGGANGFTVEKDLKKDVSVDLSELRTTLTKYLSTVDGLDPQRPMSFRDLRVVAFLQNDETKEVLQAAEVAVK